MPKSGKYWLLAYRSAGNHSFDIGSTVHGDHRCFGLRIDRLGKSSLAVSLTTVNRFSQNLITLQIFSCAIVQ